MLTTDVSASRAMQNQGCSAPSYGVQSALKDLGAQIDEAENLSDNMRSAVGISNPPSQKGEQNFTLADTLRAFANRLADANSKQREVLQHLSS